MRRVVFHDEAETDLLNQLDYLISKDARAAALDLETRVQRFLARTLAAYPLIGHAIDHEVYECPVPRSNIVVWYIFTDRELTIVDVWHDAQDRRAHLRDDKNRSK